MTTHSGVIIVPGESDPFTQFFERGVTYSIDVHGLPNGDADPVSPGVFDPFLTISLNGVFKVSDDDSGPGFDSHIDFTPTQSGNYTLAVSGFGSETGDYDLTIA
jgi:hypothetical protein